MKKINIFKICLIAITFFNCLFFSMEDAFSLTQKAVVGPKDRVRKFDDLIFTYTAPNHNNDNLDKAGFSCKPGGLKYMAFDESGLDDVFDKGIGASYYAVINLLFFPLLCSQLLNIFKSTVGKDGGGLRSFIVLLVGIFGFKSLEYIENLIFDQDDFSMDNENPYCIAVSLSILASCIAITTIAEIKGIKTKYKIISIIALDAAANAVKEGFKTVQFAIANAVFHSFELCGDNWLTYGDETIENNLDGRSILQNQESSTWDTWIKYISEAYPTKGAFRGSYKYKINKCFVENDINYCRVLYEDQSLSSESLAEKLNLLYKPYREFYYDGIEFEYTGCTDPRPDRKTFLGANDENSQLYYFRGSDSANFACDRFLMSGDKEYRDAYKCCLEASQKFICINNNVENKHIMCDKDVKKCKMDHKLNLKNLVGYDKSKYDAQKEDNSNICKKLKEERDKKCEDNSNSADCDSAKSSYNGTCDENGNFKSENMLDNLTNKTSETTTFNIDKTIEFQIRQSIIDTLGNKYCVETYNLCPYNFRLLGGTEQYGNEFSMTNDSGFEVEEKSGTFEQKNANVFDKGYNEKNNCSFDKDGNRHCDGPCVIDDKIYACYNKPSNFCQIDRHCVYVQPLVEKKNNSLSPYIDKACLDGIGSSHNFLNYETPLAGTNKNQTVMVTPIVECVVETFKNILFNRAGHTICRDINDEVIGDICLNSDVIIKQGDDLAKSDYKSPFFTIKNYFINIIKAILVLSVILYGYNIILFRKGATPEEILKYVLTLTLVIYFSLSSNWINSVFNSIYSIYNKVSEFAVDILAEDKEKYNYDNPKYSGCFFFNGLYVDNKYDTYKDRKYLAVFDTFDCKLSRYFGYYSNNIANPPIISIFIMGIFTAGLSILTMLPFILLFVSILFFVVRIAYIFVVNSLTITILLFMTPIFIPMVLFERTKGFFQSWLKKILQNVMSPLFIFMALSLFFVIFDKYFIADATFYGRNEPIRSVYCDTVCKISENNYFHIDSNNNDQKQLCNESKGKVINLKRNAPICAVQDHGVSNRTGIGLIDFILEDFPGLPGLPKFSDITDQMEGFFNMFFDLIFLLILIFIFEQFISYVNAMTGSIFSSDGVNPARGIDDDASGLPSLQKVNQVVATSGAKMANKSKDILRYIPVAIYNKQKEKSKKGKQDEN